MSLTLVGCSNAPTTRVAAPRAPSAGPASEATHSAKSYQIHGIDVSKHQGQIDWQAVASSGTRFAYIKATEGADHIDERFAENWDGAKTAGLARGAYHFVYWCRPWRQEVEWFFKNVPNEPDSLPPVLDVEATPESRSCTKTLYPRETAEQIRHMLAAIEKHYNKKPILYTNINFYNTIIADGGLDNYPIWVSSFKHHPNSRVGNREWKFWQYTERGTVPGIPKAVDRNVFHGTTAEWKRWLVANRSAGAAVAAADDGDQTASIKSDSAAAGQE